MNIIKIYSYLFIDKEIKADMIKPQPKIIWKY
jgi:hypothetical protein